MNRRHIRTAIATLLTGALLGCGGSSDDASPAKGLEAYAGTWTQCDGQGQLDKYTLRLEADQSLKGTLETDYFAAADCSGSPGATLFYEASATSVLRRVGEAGVPVLFPDGQKKQVETELFELTQGAGVPKVVSRGMNVSRTIVNFGVPEICIEGVAGKNLCFKESEETLSARTDLAMMLLDGDVLYVIDDGASTGDGTFEANALRRQR